MGEPGGSRLPEGPGSCVTEEEGVHFIPEPVLPKSQLRRGLRADRWVSDGGLDTCQCSGDKSRVIKQGSREKIRGSTRKSNILTERCSENVPLTMIY